MCFGKARARMERQLPDRIGEHSNPFSFASRKVLRFSKPQLPLNRHNQGNPFILQHLLVVSGWLGLAAGHCIVVFAYALSNQRLKIRMLQVVLRMRTNGLPC